MVKYLGSKRTLLPAILGAIDSIPGRGPVLDLFSGTSRVGHALKRRGHRVIANDHNTYAHALAACYIQADAEDHARDAELLVAEFNRLAASTRSPLAPEAPDPFTQTYCIDARFFHPDNGPRIAAVRAAIAEKCLDPELEAILLTSLIEAADRVDSTTGLQMAYLKSWAARALRPLELRVPALLPRAADGKGQAHCLDALEAARRHGRGAHIAYIDPPYNQHSYLANYHIWETIVRWDHPQVYGAARKRTDCRTRTSPFNSRLRCLPALSALLDALDTPNLIVSFSDEGFISRAEMESLLSARGRLRTLEHDHKRYVGAQIGIYNPGGVKVGRVSHLRNTEYLYIVMR